MPSENKNTIGVIGLAVMGANLARNFASRGISTAVFNRTYQRTKDLLEQHSEQYQGKLVGYEKLEDFVKSLEKPKRVILMVQSGSPVDDVLNALRPLLEIGDYIIDGGNSYFEDTEKRHQTCAEVGLNFLGMGISGGEEGALNGPSLMPGLNKEDWKNFAGILDLIAAKDFDGQPCVAPIGPGGAGHYVKMVHNGIEYAMMQMIAEIYDFNRKAKNLSAKQIAGVFENISNSSASSFLSEITAKVLDHLDVQTGRPLVDLILDKAAQKGTGGWTSIESIKLGAAAEVIGEAVAARSMSSFKDIRENISNNLKRKVLPSEQDINWDKVMLFGMLISYSQGLRLIKLASDTHQWNVDLAEVTRIWQGGCIIRSKLLIEIGKALVAQKNLNELLENKDILILGNDCLEEVQKLVCESARIGLAIPATSSALNYFFAISESQSPANLIQGLRDFFGAHTFERTDQPGVFHENWNENK